MSQLTQRQSDALNAIKLYRERTGFPPTISELAGLIGCSSPNAAADHVRALKRKGYITVAPGAARGITVIDYVQDTDAESIIKALLNGGENARENAVAWLKSRGVKP